LRQSGLKLREVGESAGVGKETIRRALYGRGVSVRTARALAGVIGAGLSEEKIHALEGKLCNAPRNNF
jgi:transcriptional regulator with XRE-family HTH domain